MCENFKFQGKLAHSDKGVALQFVTLLIQCFCFPDIGPSFHTGSVSIPDNTPIDSHVIDFDVRDEDHGDMWYDWGLDYGHTYFYLDTNKGIRIISPKEEALFFHRETRQFYDMHGTL